MSQTANTLIMMLKSNNPSIINSKTANQKNMTSQMHLGSNIPSAKHHKSNVLTDIPTDVTKYHKIQHNPSTTLQNKSENTGHKANTHCILRSDIIPNMRLDVQN